MSFLAIINFSNLPSAFKLVTPVHLTTIPTGNSCYSRLGCEAFKPQKVHSVLDFPIFSFHVDSLNYLCSSSKVFFS